MIIMQILDEKSTVHALRHVVPNVALQEESVAKYGLKLRRLQHQSSLHKASGLEMHKQERRFSAIL